MVSTSSKTSTSSTLPPRPHHWVHDVFLSFRGRDTRNNFTTHLYYALVQRGIKAYKDDRELERGSNIEPELWKAIEESMFSIVIFSKDYASSPWCLDELVKIIHCWKTRGQKVLPVFYDVDPTEDVANQKGSYEKAFVGYEEEFKNKKEKVKMWRDALSDAAKLSGWSVRNKNEFEIIKKIVNTVWPKVSKTLSIADKGLVGMDFHLKKMSRILQEDRSMDVRFIGIYGMGGVGKTTIATAVYDRIHWQFELCCFLANVKEAFNNHNGVVLLQRQILSKLHQNQDIMLSDARSGVAEIRKCLKDKKTLIILDDVDDLKQLELLVGERNWFGSGSRVIITSRDSHLLSTYGVDGIYKVDVLNKHESLMLFSRKAFRQDLPPKSFLKLSKRVLAHADGLPLALLVLGSFLYDRSTIVWQNAIDRLHKTSHDRIMDVLQISFDNLEESQKQIFLDIACFFDGMDKERVTNILDECGFNAHIGIEVLIEKSLLRVNEKKLHMHELLKVMGRNIVNQECPNEPRRRSRLLDPQEIDHAFENTLGNEVVEVILLNECINKQWNMEAFSTMKRLRILKFRHSREVCKVGPTYLSSELRYIEWDYYPSKSLPFSFQPNKLVELHLKYGSIKQLWSGNKVLNCLKILILYDCKNLVKTPDFTGIPNLEKLILSGSNKLSELHPSFQNLKKLVVIRLLDCKNLKQFASKIEMESLQILHLIGCSKLKNFPTIGGAMPHLHKLCLSRTKLKTLPDSIHNFVGLVSLELQSCRKLQNLPNRIVKLKSLKELDLYECSTLKELPENMCELESLEFLDLRKTGIRKLPGSTFPLTNLKKLALGDGYHSYRRLNFHVEKMEKLEVLVLPALSSMFSLQILHLDYCNLGERSIPDDIGCLFNLTSLTLSGGNFVSLPRSISQLSMLLKLHLENCKMLRSLPEIPPHVEDLSINGCIALEEVPDPLELRSPNDSIFWCFNCTKLYEKKGGDDISPKMIQQYIKGLSKPRPAFGIIIPGREIPNWFTNRSKGLSVTIPTPRDFLHGNGNSKWMGVAACVSFSVAQEDYYDCRIHSIIDNKEEQLDHVRSFATPKMYGGAKSDHFWSFYLSIHRFKKWQGKFIGDLRLSFDSSPLYTTIKMCGARLVSCEDAYQEFVTDCWSNNYEDVGDDTELDGDDEHLGFFKRASDFLLHKADQLVDKATDVLTDLVSRP